MSLAIWVPINLEPLQSLLISHSKELRNLLAGLAGTLKEDGCYPGNKLNGNCALS